MTRNGQWSAALLTKMGRRHPKRTTDRSRPAGFTLDDVETVRVPRAARERDVRQVASRPLLMSEQREHHQKSINAAKAEEELRHDRQGRN